MPDSLLGEFPLDATTPAWPVSPWADPVFNDRLKELHMRGLSFSEIAAELCKLGRKVSRNAVIGRAKRLKLPPRAQPIKKSKPKSESKSVSLRRKTYTGAWKPAVEDKPTATTAGPFLGLSLIELGAEHCRYPHGEGVAITFCGQPIVRENSSYCAAHHDRCHIRSMPR